MTPLRSPSGFSTLRMAEEKVEEVFKQYHSERYPVVKAAFENSYMFIRNLGKMNDLIPAES